MSLRTFHLIFITAASALAFGCGIWKLIDFFGPDGRPLDLLFGLGSLAAGAGLLLYERYVFRKLKRVEEL